MHRQTVVILGATGMVGGLLLQQLLQSDHFSAIRILVRKPFSIQTSEAGSETGQLRRCR